MDATELRSERASVLVYCRLTASQYCPRYQEVTAVTADDVPPEMRLEAGHCFRPASVGGTFVFSTVYAPVLSVISTFLQMGGVTPHNPGAEYFAELVLFGHGLAFRKIVAEPCLGI